MKTTIQIYAIALLSFLLAGADAFAQSKTIVHQGTIIFERKENMPVIVQNNKLNDLLPEIKSSMDTYVENNPKFTLGNFKLLFNENAALYTPEGEPKTLFPVDNNTVYSDLAKPMSIAIKRFHGRTFYIQDSLKNITWKITDEYRDIAGYECRRANGITTDSTYVVAFYTDQIIPRVGPESFNGLPGMILGVALPHENMSWFAKSVTVSPTSISIDAPKAPMEGILNRKTFLEAAFENKNIGDNFNTNFVIQRLEL